MAKESSKPSTGDDNTSQLSSPWIIPPHGARAEFNPHKKNPQISGRSGPYIPLLDEQDITSAATTPDLPDPDEYDLADFEYTHQSRNESVNANASDASPVRRPDPRRSKPADQDGYFSPSLTARSRLAERYDDDADLELGISNDDPIDVLSPVDFEERSRRLKWMIPVALCCIMFVLVAVGFTHILIEKMAEDS